MNSFRSNIFLLVILPVLLFTINIQAQTVRYVDGTGTDSSNCSDMFSPCATIFYTLGEATPGDTIEIAAGAYTEANGLHINKSITIRGAGEDLPGGTVIQAHTQHGEATNRVITIEGGFVVEVSDLTIRHGLAKGEEAESHGGGIYIADAALVLVNVNLSSNFALGSGGGVFSDDSNSKFVNVTFDKNEASAFGGGIFNRFGTSTFKNVTFNDNTAISGGGMQIGDSEVTLTDVVLNGNSASSLGGGIYNISNDLKLTNVSFAENTANSGGGMINVQTSPTLTSVSFTGNNANTGGGMVNYVDSAPSLTNVTFISNVALTTGGGIYNYSSSPILTNVILQENIAANGGGIHNLDSSPVLTHVTFEGNNVEFNGGGMYNTNDGNVALKNVIFRGNSANNGGGVFINDGSSTLTNAVFYANTANYGAGIALIGGSNSITNVTLSRNIAQDGGGGIYNGLSSVLKLTNTVVWDNKAVNVGNEIYHEGDNSLEMNYCLYGDDDGDIDIDGDGDIITVNAISKDPLFMDAQAENFRLLGGSPAIDSGYPDIDFTFFPVNGDGDPIDMDGNPRIFGEIIDIGAYEFQSLNAPQLLNPVDLDNVELPPIFEWEVVAGALSYQLQVTLNEDSFNQLVIDESELTDNKITVDGLESAMEYYWRVRAINNHTVGPWSTVRKFTTATNTSVVPKEEMPTQTTLYQNYPNPFNPTTNIRYALPADTHVQLAVYDMLGRRMALLVNERQNAGYHRIYFDGSGFSSGVYFYRIKTGNFVKTNRMSLIK